MTAQDTLRAPFWRLTSGVVHKLFWLMNYGGWHLGESLGGECLVPVTFVAIEVRGTRSRTILNGLCSAETTHHRINYLHKLMLLSTRIVELSRIGLTVIVGLSRMVGVHRISLNVDPLIIQVIPGPDFTPLRKKLNLFKILL